MGTFGVAISITKNDRVHL